MRAYRGPCRFWPLENFFCGPKKLILEVVCRKQTRYTVHWRTPTSSVIACICTLFHYFILSLEQCHNAAGIVLKKLLKNDVLIFIY